MRLGLEGTVVAGQPNERTSGARRPIRAFWCLECGCKIWGDRHVKNLISECGGEACRWAQIKAVDLGGSPEPGRDPPADPLLARESLWTTTTANMFLLIS